MAPTTDGRQASETTKGSDEALELEKLCVDVARAIGRYLRRWWAGGGGDASGGVARQTTRSSSRRAGTTAIDEGG